MGGHRHNYTSPVDSHILLLQLSLDVTQVAGEYFQDGEGLLAQPHRGGGGQGRGCQSPLEAAQQGGPSAGGLPGSETVDELAIAQGRQRGDEVVLIAVLVAEAEDRVVAPVSARDDGTSRSQVDPQVDVSH